MDRTHSGDTGFHDAFPSISRAPIAAGPDGSYTLQIFVDHCSVEVFGNARARQHDRTDLPRCRPNIPRPVLHRRHSRRCAPTHRFRKGNSLMEHRKLGSSGLYISEIAYGNWFTHGEQIDQAAATQCVKQALDLGITTFDTADAYAGTRPRKRWARRSKEHAVKAWRFSPRPTSRPGRAGTTVACPANTSWSPSTHRSAGSRPTMSISTRLTGTTTRPRWKRRCRPSPILSGPGKRTTSGCRSGRRTRSGPELPLRKNLASSSSPTSRSIPCCGASSNRRSFP